MGYPLSVKENCLKMYVNRLGLGTIERISGVNHNTIIRWVKAYASSLPSAPLVEKIPAITEIDQLQTFVGKKNKKWLWTVVSHWQPGILLWALGDRFAQTFEPLWNIIRGGESFLYVKRRQKTLRYKGRGHKVTGLEEATERKAFPVCFADDGTIVPFLKAKGGSWFNPSAFCLQGRSPGYRWLVSIPLFYQ